MALRASCAQAGVASRARARSRSVSSQCSNPVAVSALGARCVALGAVVASGTLVAGWAIDTFVVLNILVCGASLLYARSIRSRAVVARSASGASWTGNALIRADVLVGCARRSNGVTLGQHVVCAAGADVARGVRAAGSTRSDGSRVACISSERGGIIVGGNRKAARRGSYFCAATRRVGAPGGGFSGGASCNHRGSCGGGTASFCC